MARYGRLRGRKAFPEGEVDGLVEAERHAAGAGLLELLIAQGRASLVEAFLAVAQPARPGPAAAGRATDLGEYEPARDAFWAARLAVADRVLERAESRGELRPGLDRHVAVETLVAPLSLRMLLTREPLDDAFIETVADLVTGGIQRRR